mmetsp:Transcript_40566/g.79946  ORF Transcript_40566/g.79946 Transcript_40566/m.79946 type:complete len:119 (+) Transcript_40566:111-467(+)
MKAGQPVKERDVFQRSKTLLDKASFSCAFVGCSASAARVNADLDADMKDKNGRKSEAIEPRCVKTCNIFLFEETDDVSEAGELAGEECNLIQIKDRCFSFHVTASNDVETVSGIFCEG